MLGFVCYMLIILYKMYLCLYEWAMSDILEKVSLFIYGSPASRKYNPPFSRSALFCADPLSGSESRSVT